MRVDQIFDKAFHEHLDDCQQCANYPFNLCEVGELLLMAAVRENCQ